jgi:putative peptidoglycan lipid II flippase
VSTNKSAHASIVKSASIIGLGTFISRLLGFARDMVLARLFGVYTYAQAFVVAFKIPNLFRDLLGEGAANAVFVPVFSEYRIKHTDAQFWELANVILNVLVVVVSAVTICGAALAPLIVRVIAPGFASDGHKLATTIRLTQFIFPYILLVSLTAYATSILNTLKHFSLPALAPCLLNIAIIVCAMVFGESILGLSLGVLIGGFLQLAVLVPVLYRKGFRLRLFGCFKHPSAKTIYKLMIPRIFSSSMYQLNNFVDSIFGSLAIAGEGGVAVLYFSYRLIQFPLGLFSNSLTQALLPTLSTQALEDSRQNLKNTLSFGLRTTFLVMVPASVAFAVLSESIIKAIFEGGRFGAQATGLTVGALCFYSIGLSAYAGTKLLQTCFFALKDTATPAKISAIALVVNIVLNAILIFPLKVSGLALATSLSGINSFLLLFFILRKRLTFYTEARVVMFSFGRILAASLGMGLVCWWSTLNPVVAGNGILPRGVNLGVSILAGLLSYIALGLLFKVREMHEIARIARARF